MAKAKKAKTAKKATAKSAKKSAKKSRGRKPNAAFMAAMTPEPARWQQVVGSKPLPRTEVTKKLWAYIKKNGLQDQKNRRMIKADDNLKAVFGGKTHCQHVRDDQARKQAPEVTPDLSTPRAPSSPVWARARRAVILSRDQSVSPTN